MHAQAERYVPNLSLIQHGHVGHLPHIAPRLRQLPRHPLLSVPVDSVGRLFVQVHVVLGKRVRPRLEEFPKRVEVRALHARDADVVRAWPTRHHHRWTRAAPTDCAARARATRNACLPLLLHSPVTDLLVRDAREVRSCRPRLFRSSGSARATS